MVIRRLASLPVVTAIALLLFAGLASLAGAQVTPDCTTGCVTYSVLVTGGGSVSHPTSSGPHSVSFVVWNTGNVTDAYTLTCSRTGGITCGTVTPSSVTLSPSPVQPIMGMGVESNGVTATASNATVTVTYSVGASSGSVTLTATGTGPGAPSSSATLTVTAVAPPGAPQVVLRNHSRDNVDRSLCLTAGAGESAAWGCGDLVITHSMPGYSTMGRERSLTLIHNSATAYARPPIAAVVTQPTGVGQPNTVFAELKVGTTVRTTASYNGWPSGTGGARQIVLDFNAAGDATGAHPIELRVQNQYTGSVHETLIKDTLLIVSRFFDEFGAGFSLAGLEQLYFNQPVGTTLGHIFWVGGDGSAKLYRKLTATTWIAPPGAFRDTLVLSGGVYTRTMRHGIKVRFNSAGRHIATVNRAGQQTTFTYNAAGNRLISIQVPPACGAACTYTLAYDVTPSNNLDYIMDPAGRKLDATFNVDDGRLSRLTDPDGNKVDFGWDGDRRIVSRKSRRGFTTTYEYSLGRALGSRVSKVTIPVGRTSADAATAVTTFDAWNDKGLAVGASGQVAVDTAQAYTKIFGPRPGVADDASFWVDRWGAPTKIVNPLGFITRVERGDAAVPSLVTKVVSPDLLVDSMRYDTRGNLLELHSLSTGVQQSTPLPNAKTRWTYKSANTKDSPDSLIDAEGVVTRYAYDSLGLTSQVTAPNGHVTQFVTVPNLTFKGLVRAVNELSVPVWNQTAKTEPAATLHRGFGFNALGNVTSDTLPTGKVQRYARGNAQRVDTLIDPAGHKVRFTYDSLNRPVDVIELVTPTPLVTRTAYNIDVVASVTDPRGVIRSWQYDNAGRQIGETDDWNHTELRFFNAAGQIDSVRQRVFEGATGAVIRYVYDAAGQRTKMAWPTRPYPPSAAMPGDSVLYTYDNVGRILTATTSGTRNVVGDTITWPRKITRTYFARGETRSEVQSRANGTVSYRNTYSYDRLGRRTSHVLGTPGSQNYSDSIAYTYRTNGELNSIRMRWRGATETALKDSVVFKWDPMGRRDTLRYSDVPNPTTIKFAYDSSGVLRLLCGTDNTTTSDNVLRFTYNNSLVDDDGLIKSTVTVPMPAIPGCGTNGTLAYTQTNTYDGRHQLATMSRTTGEGHIYSYDGSGNMLRDDQPSVSTDFDYVILANHNQVERRVPSVGTVTRYLYDANGSRAFECSGTSGCDPTTLTYRKYYHDGLGRMVGTDESVPNGTQVYFPDYDPMGRMAHAADSPVSFGYDGDNVVRTNPDSASVNWTIVHGPNVDDPLIAHYVVLSAGAINMQKTLYFVTDGQGRQYAVGDSLGRNMSGDLDFSQRGGKYAGGTLNAASFGADRSTPASMKQLSFFRNRFYDQQSGRWTQEDPIGVAGGVNLYQFNGNNPVMFMDPFGLLPCKEYGNCTQSDDGRGGMINPRNSGAIIPVAFPGEGASPKSLFKPKVIIATFARGEAKQISDAITSVAGKKENTRTNRQEVGEFLEAEKAAGRGGSKNDRGDFTFRELVEKVREFFGAE